MDHDDIRLALDKYEAALYEDVHAASDETAATLESARESLMTLLRQTLAVPRA